MIFLNKSIHLKLTDFFPGTSFYDKVLHTYWKQINYCIQNFGQHNFGWIVVSGCTCGQADWGASLSLSNIFASLVVVNLRPKPFWWPHQKRHTILLVLWDLHSVILPKWLSKYGPTRYIKCILVVSLCHCIRSGVFQVLSCLSSQSFS